MVSDNKREWVEILNALGAVEVDIGLENVGQCSIFYTDPELNTPLDQLESPILTPLI